MGYIKTCVICMCKAEITPECLISKIRVKDCCYKCLMGLADLEWG